MNDYYDAIAQEAQDRRDRRNALSPSEQFTKGLRANANKIRSHKCISLIPKFLEYNSLSIVYGDSGSGKSMLTLTMCIHLLVNTDISTVNYYDFDNGDSDQKKRGIPDLLDMYEETFNYVTLDSLDDNDLTPSMVLDGLAINNGTKMPYTNQLFIFDTMGELVEGSLGKDDVMRPLLEKLKTLRTMGATIIVLHHTTKEKGNVSFFGSNYIKIKIDALWYLTPKDTIKDDYMEFALQNKKDRSGDLRDSAFSIVPSTHTLHSLDYTLTSIDSKETDFINSVKAILNDDTYVELSQKDLLIELGIDPKNKKYVEWLKKYVDKYWNSRVNDFPRTIIYSTL